MATPITINANNEDENMKLLDSFIEGIEEGMRERGESVADTPERRAWLQSRTKPLTEPPAVPGATA